MHSKLSGVENKMKKILNDPLFVHSSEATILINNQLSILGYNTAAQKQFSLKEKDLLSHVSIFINFDMNNIPTIKLLDVKETYSKLLWLKLQNGQTFLANIKVIPYEEEYYLLLINNLSLTYGDSLINKIAEKFFTHSAEGIIVTDKNKNIILVNEAFKLVTGYTQEEMINATPSILKSGIHDFKFYKAMWNQIMENGSWSGEIWNRKKSGEVYPEWLTISAIYNNYNEVVNYVALFTDISEQKSIEAQLKFLAHHDPLTGVQNRYSLNLKLTNLIEMAKKEDNELAVLFLDLDRFKYVNDTLGHNFGDELLKQVSMRLKHLLEAKDIIARLGGDEFVIVVPNLHHAKEAIVLAEEITKSLKESFYLENMEIIVTTSIGISIFPHDGQTLEELIINADKAMYVAKANGRNNFEIYHKELQSNESEKMMKEMYLRKAIERKELNLYFQPIIDCKLNKVTSVEALIRWNQTELGYVPANELIQIAEDTGLIIPITEWTIREACSKLAILHLNGYTHLKMAINISGIVFQQDNFIKMVKDILEQTNICAEYITMELTESVIMANKVETNLKLSELKKLGISISIDDFGTGYSSLSYLKEFPIDKLKIDQSFVKGLQQHKEDRNITSAIINLGHSLKLKIIAEGVEEQEQLQFLIDEKCDFIQGYYYSKPIPLPELIDFLEIWDLE